jgi:RimJ/RimL family protein N-acetyltransferase
VELRQDIYSKTPLLGYWLSEQYWGKGIITEAVKLITVYAFSNLDIICIQACVLSKNQASMRVLEKAGYIKQGILKQSVIKNNQVFDEHVYAAYQI